MWYGKNSNTQSEAKWYILTFYEFGLDWSWCFAATSSPRNAFLNFL